VMWCLKAAVLCSKGWLDSKFMVVSVVVGFLYMSISRCVTLTPKSASVVPPEDGRLTPETCRGPRHNKVIVKVNMLLSWLRYSDISGHLK
jgi:hypothetical protein